MEHASRIVSILLGIAMTVLLWPVAVPLGFGEVWWASQKAQSQSDAKPVPAAAPPQPEVAPAPKRACRRKPQGSPPRTRRRTQHAVAPRRRRAPEPAQPPQADAKAEQTAALNEK